MSEPINMTKENVDYIQKALRIRNIELNDILLLNVIAVINLIHKKQGEATLSDIEELSCLISYDDFADS